MPLICFPGYPPPQASYWNSKAYAVKGWVCDGDGTVVRQLAGTWNEAMFCGDGEECIWRSGRWASSGMGDAILCTCSTVCVCVSKVCV